ncbi:MAG: MFS transporter [Promethearchaeota archaeon]
MNEITHTDRRKTYRSITTLYFMMFFCGGILPVNISNLLIYLPNTTRFGIGIVTASALIIGIISILSFGYFSDKISEKSLRKKIFIYTNLIWIVSYGLASFSLNYYFYLLVIITGAVGSGAFLPIGFSMISDLYSPIHRGKAFGGLQFNSVLGGGMGIILGGLLGGYVGPLGWRFAYGLGSALGVLVLIRYISSAIEPERGRAEPEFEDFQGELNYNYKITLVNLKKLFTTKSLGAILLAVLCGGIANTTLGTWAIFYLETKFGGADAGFLATTIYILAGSGALPGIIVGGRLGDRYYKAGKYKGRVIIPIIGLSLGISLQMAFYLIPFASTTVFQIILSWIFFLIIGYFGAFFVGFSSGNQFAIYSEVALPEVRGTANAMNGLMVNIGGIFGNFLLSSMIESNISSLPSAIFLVLLIWLCGSFFWIIPYFYYTKELKECRETLTKRRNELEETRNKKKEN